MNKKSSALLVGFGGPTQPEELSAFLKSVLDGISIPDARLREVVSHYETVGSISPYNSMTYKQKAELDNWFTGQTIRLPVQVAFRHSRPSFADMFHVFKNDQIEEVIAFILAPFRCYASFEKYQEKVEAARRETQAFSVQVRYTQNFFDDPLFIEAHAANIAENLKKMSGSDLEKTFFIFSAHSIPTDMDEKSGYSAQFEKFASLVAQELNWSPMHWSLAYQSRSGSPNQPWLLPDVKDMIHSLDTRIFKNVVLIPAGFLCENVEVLYDLDIDAKKTCEDLVLQYFRVPAISGHPKMIELMGRFILKECQK